MKNNRKLNLILQNMVIVFLFSVLIGCAQPMETLQSDVFGNNLTELEEQDTSAVPDSGETYAIVNGNIPYFNEEEFTTEAFETYSELDELGRCGVAYANICKELMPTEERGKIGMIKPSGWHTVKYDWVDGKYLYNRCHLIGFQLAGENANEKNLITGTRYMNTQGMLPFENMVADYVKETNYHVLYRVTPDFEGDNLVASGVEMEAWSVEDNGDGICFHVYVYNMEPGVEIDYATGDSWEAGNNETDQEQNTSDVKQDAAESIYILNTNTKRFHLSDCTSVNQIKKENKEEYKGNRQELVENGYLPCGNCKP